MDKMSVAMAYNSGKITKAFAITVLVNMHKMTKDQAVALIDDAVFN